MLKNTLSVAAATIAIVASASLPALAIVDNEEDLVTEIPEPTTVLGLMTFAGGALLTKKRIDSQKAE